MDRDLESKIDILIHKFTNDLKTRIVREVTRSMNRVLKEQARELKSSTSKKVGKVHASLSEKPIKSGRSNNKYESDSDDYYSD